MLYGYRRFIVYIKMHDIYQDIAEDVKKDLMLQTMN